MVTNSYPKHLISRDSVRALEPPYYLTAGFGIPSILEEKENKCCPTVQATVHPLADLVPLATRPPASRPPLF